MSMDETDMQMQAEAEHERTFGQQLPDGFFSIIYPWNEDIEDCIEYQTITDDEIEFDLYRQRLEV